MAVEGASTTSDSPSKRLVRQVLQRTAPLRRTLSLRQLVPVHAAFLQQQQHETTAAAVAAPASSGVTDLFSLASTDAERLLVVQYCLLQPSQSQRIEDASTTYTTSRSQRCVALSQLSQIVLPTIFSASSSSQHQDSSSSASTQDGDQQHGLLEALLDAVLISGCATSSTGSSSRTESTTNTTTSEQDEEMVLLKSCLDQIKTAASASSDKDNDDYYWSASCRILQRLYHWPTSSASGQRLVILSALADQVLWFLSASSEQKIGSSSSNNNRIETSLKMSRWYRPLTIDVLPCLMMEGRRNNGKKEGASSSSTTTTAQQHDLDRIWTALWASPTPDLMATTAVLCSILPSLLDRELPTATGGCVDETNKLRPVQQMELWNLIQTCVGQGILTVASDDDDGNSHKTTTVHPTLQQLVRRRGLYLLRVLVENDETDASNMSSWNKYVACFETLEMESEVHLIDQVWNTVTELFEEAAANGDISTVKSGPPHISWAWMQLLLGRAVVPPPERARDDSSSTLRKVSMFRLLKGQAGIRVAVESATEATTAGKVKEPATAGKATDTAASAGTDADADDREPSAQNNKHNRNPKKKSKQQKKKNPKDSNKKNQKSKAPQVRGAPLGMISVDFVFSLLIASYDSLLTTVGTKMQTTEAMANLAQSDTGGKNIVAEDMDELLRNFIASFLDTLILRRDDAGLQEFVRRLWSTYTLDHIHKKTCIRIFQTVEDTLRKRNLEGILPVANDMLSTLAESVNYAFVYGSVLSHHRETLLRTIATMLAYSKPCSTVEGKQPYTPNSILSVLALYPVPLLEGTPGGSNGDQDVATWIERDPSLSSLRSWLKGNKDICRMGATVATAFVDGFMQSSSTQAAVADTSARSSVTWDPKTGCSNWERSTAKAISLLCILPSPERTSSTESGTTTSEMLWPAIAKGLSRAPAATMGSWAKADCVSRALLLLEIGCQLQVLSGMGNGTLVVDKKSQQMMPPPPNIESMLANSVSFVFHHIRSLVTSSDDWQSGRASRSNNARVLSLTFARLVAQLEVLSKGFIGSMAISTSVGEVLNDCISAVASSRASTDWNPALQVALLYAALSSGGEINAEKALSVSMIVLKMEFSGAVAMRIGNAQALRSLFQYAKWGALSRLLPKNLKIDDKTGVNSFVDELFDEAADAVESAPVNAILPLFDCLVAAAKGRFAKEAFKNGQLDIQDDIRYLSKVVAPLFGLIEESDTTINTLYMIDEICTLIFQPALLLDEYLRLLADSGCDTPIRDAFRRFITMAGTQRTHISRVVLSRICASWLRAANDSQEEIGLSAIPYREDIANLLIHKEEAAPLSSTSARQSHPRSDNAGESLQLVDRTDETSISRGFLLVFLSKLPDVNDGLSPSVVKHLLHFVITTLLDKIPPKGKGAIMHGTDEYIVKIRALQALCVMARFITSDIANIACERIYEAMDKGISHNQIRYFVEILALQCSRKFPEVFGTALGEQITRTDLSLQMVASLMIISGNLIVGRYQKDFFIQNKDGDPKVAVNLHLVLSGAIPWLSSTQGFSRAIAQLLTYKLIPMVVDVKEKVADEDNDWYLRSIYRFLDENPQMKRLRKKQAQFFDEYEADSVCTPGGVFAIPVDEGSEADPVHLIEVIKECLVDTYDEANIGELPLWKQIENANADMKREENDSATTIVKDGPIVNFQRKIIPLDALNLTLEDMKERKSKNAAGRRKQQLIVCASLIDKVPNLGGLARTSEIFAADRLVIQDLQVSMMDNFKSLSVSAGDWIEIEECKEKDLLAWLRQRRAQGYHVVGLEQTSSSVSLGGYTFPNQPTVLLLGREKEGIPVEFLQAVDQCLEIPQLGLIRSLNVHVSGAIAIWEFTKQQQLKNAG